MAHVHDDLMPLLIKLFGVSIASDGTVQNGTAPSELKTKIDAFAANYTALQDTVASQQTTISQQSTALAALQGSFNTLQAAVNDGATGLAATKALASAAKTAADAASTTATTAKNSADTATTAANTASSTATTAKTTADAAATTAATAKTTADTVSATVNNTTTGLAATKAIADANSSAVSTLNTTTIPAINTAVGNRLRKDANDSTSFQITAPAPNSMSAIVRKSDLINGVTVFRRYLRGVNANVTGASTLTGETVAVTEAVPGASLQVDSIKITTTTMPAISGPLTVYANGIVIYQRTILLTDAVLVLNRAIELLNLTATTLPTNPILIGSGISFTATFGNGGVANIRVSGDQVP